MKKFIPVFLLFISSKIFSAIDTVNLNLEWERRNALVQGMSMVYDEANRPYLYVASKNGGLQIFDVSQPDTGLLVQTIPTPQFDSLEVMNIFQQGNYLFLALGNYFGSNPQKPGLAIVDVTTPASATISDVWSYATVEKGGGIVVVDGNYAYLGAMTKGLFILNVSNKSNIQFVSEFLPDKNWPLNNPTASQTPNARGMAVRDDVIYLCYDAGGIRVLNVSDKLHPYEISHYINGNFSNKQQAYNNIFLNGNLAYVGIDYCGFEILDISDTANILQVGWWNPWRCDSTSNLWVNSPGHINEVNYDAANQLVFLSAGQSEVIAIDVSDSQNPEQAGIYSDSAQQQGTWGICRHGNEIFATYINAFVPFFSNWQGIKKFTYTVLPTGVEIIPYEEMKVFPNPTTEAFQVSSFIFNSGRISLFNSDGRKILEQKISSNEKINVRHLPCGFYVAEIISAEKVWRMKLLKQ